MAEPWMDNSINDEQAAVRPFDRQALQATLADALRRAETSEFDAGTGARTSDAPTPPGPAAPAWTPPPASAMQGAPSAPPGLHLAAPAPAPPPRPSGFGPAGQVRAGQVPAGQVPAGQVPAGPVPAGPVRTAAPAGPVPAGPVPAGLGRSPMPPPAPSSATGPAPTPPRAAPSPLDLNSVLSRPAAHRASNPFGPSKLPVDPPATSSGEPVRRSVPSILGGGSGGGFGNPSALGGSLSGLGDFSTVRPTPSETPAERATIPLRRPEARLPHPPAAPPAPVAPAAAGPGAAATASAGPGAGATVAAAHGGGVAVAVEAPPVPAWSPLDDDIIPHSAGKQSFRLRR